MISFFNIIIILTTVAFITMTWILVKRLKNTGIRGKSSFHTSVEQIKAVGELSVYKVFTKEIVTQTDHYFGEFGKKYLNWFLSEKKMAMIFEFEIDFRYNLRSQNFKIEGSNKKYTFYMPPCFHEIHIRDIHFYDEQKSKLIPSLLPDAISNILGQGFSEEEKNAIKDEAKKRAEEQAKRMINKLASDVEESAEQTLRTLAKALGAENIEFVFSKSGNEPLKNITYNKTA
ncbi:MAG: DUF4230 domain-containing protein [Spirochaetota bacterium]